MKGLSPQEAYAQHNKFYNKSPGMKGTLTSTELRDRVCFLIDRALEERFESQSSKISITQLYLERSIGLYKQGLLDQDMDAVVEFYTKKGWHVITTIEVVETSTQRKGNVFTFIKA